MRSPGAAFDLRAALTQELSAAIEEIDTPIPRPAAVHRCRVRLKRARALATRRRVRNIIWKKGSLENSSRWWPMLE